MTARRRRLVSLVVVGALTLGVISCGAATSSPCQPDALTSRSVAELTSFSDWVRTNGVRGVIGEVGWPDGADATRWNELAGRWYGQADTDSVGVFAWSGADRWPSTYPLAIYRRSSPEGVTPPVYAIGSQATVVEGHPAPNGSAGGVSLADGSFGASWQHTASYSSETPGVYGVDYAYPSADLLRLMKSRGVQQVRLAITWERLQPTLGTALDRAGLNHLQVALAAAATAGMSVVLDLHNYGRFAEGAGAARQVLTVGSPQLPASDLADFWRRLTTAVHRQPAVSGYGVMDEPHDLPGGAGAWETASAQTVAAIRETDQATTVFVSGYNYSSAARWTSQHPHPWISPKMWPVVYEAHQYFDTAGEGVYTQGYDANNAAAQAQGWTPCSAPPPTHSLTLLPRNTG